MQNKATWHSHDIFTIRISGTCEYVKSVLKTLVDDFNEPKFGYNGELFDEDNNNKED